MSANHTPGPWRHDKFDMGNGIVAVRSDDGLIASVRGLSDDEARANARRIVVCINYCEGVSTAEIEAAPKSMNLRAILEALDYGVSADETRAALNKAAKGGARP